MEQVISSEVRPIKMWLDDIEDGALAQAKNLANLPFVFKHIALMSDCHQGYGMPIGSVMATMGVVIPNCVGVDIGCVDKDTEFLSPDGWVKMNDYKNELVMQFDIDSGLSEFVVPLRYVKEPCKEFIKIKTKYGIDQVLSKEHRCLIYKYDRKYDFNRYSVVSAIEIMNKHNKLKNGYRHRFLTSFSPIIKTKINLTDTEIRIMVASCADGTICRKKIRANFKKKRKINRLTSLLNNANIKFRSITYKNGVTSISFYPPILKKGIHQFWKASLKQLAIICDESLLWDGDQKKCFFTRIKEEADFMNYAFSATGYRSTISIDYRDSGIDYRVFRIKKIKVGINGSPKTSITLMPSSDGYKYCFTVPSSYLVLRRNGNIFITGNCGMQTVKTSLKAKDLDKETIKKIFGGSKEYQGGIRTKVPVGFSHHSKKKGEEWLPRVPLGKTLTIVEENYEAARKQIGTLGGGK